MLKKPCRLTNNKDFQQVYRRGRNSTTPFFNIHALPNKAGITKIGIVASKKISKKAVVRNQIKRRVREISQEFYNKLIPGQNIIITIKPNAVTIEFSKLREEIQKVFVKMNLLK
jgi:ribonuclease P protein component